MQSDLDPGPMIRIKNPDLSDALMDVLDYVIIHEATDFREQMESREADGWEYAPGILRWLDRWMESDEIPPVPIELFKQCGHVFAQAIVVRASWNKRET